MFKEKLATIEAKLGNCRHYHTTKYKRVKCTMIITFIIYFVSVCINIEVNEKERPTKTKTSI